MTYSEVCKDGRSSAKVFATVTVTAAVAGASACSTTAQHPLQKLWLSAIVLLRMIQQAGPDGHFAVELAVHMPLAHLKR